MAVTDLTGTCWIFNDNISIESGFLSYNLSFNSNNAQYTYLQIMNFLSAQITYNDVLVYDNSWTATGYKTITITGGTDATNSTLIAWLEANGTLTAPQSSGKTQIGTRAITKKMFGTREITKEVVNGVTIYEKQAPSGYTASIWGNNLRTREKIWYKTDTDNDFIQYPYSWGEELVLTGVQTIQFALTDTYLYYSQYSTGDFVGLTFSAGTSPYTYVSPVITMTQNSKLTCEGTD